MFPLQLRVSLFLKLFLQPQFHAFLVGQRSSGGGGGGGQIICHHHVVGTVWFQSRCFLGWCSAGRCFGVHGRVCGGRRGQSFQSSRQSSFAFFLLFAVFFPLQRTQCIHHVIVPDGTLTPTSTPIPTAVVHLTHKIPQIMQRQTNVLLFQNVDHGLFRQDTTSFQVAVAQSRAQCNEFLFIFEFFVQHGLHQVLIDGLQISSNVTVVIGQHLYALVSFSFGFRHFWFGFLGRRLHCV